LARPTCCARRKLVERRYAEPRWDVVALSDARGEPVAGLLQPGVPAGVRANAHAYLLTPPVEAGRSALFATTDNSSADHSAPRSAEQQSAFTTTFRRDVGRRTPRAPNRACFPRRGDSSRVTGCVVRATAASNWRTSRKGRDDPRARAPTVGVRRQPTTGRDTNVSRSPNTHVGA